MDLFIGKQECSVDEKRRFSLPHKYRPLFGQQTTASGYTHPAILIPWYGGALAILPTELWNVIRTRIQSMDFTTPDLLMAKRICFPRMESVHTDPEGRLAMSPEQHAWLRLKQKGKNRVTVIGVGQHLEVWNATEWAEVERTGKNPAPRSPADVEYDAQLKVLMEAGLEAARSHRPPAEAAGETSLEES